MTSLRTLVLLGMTVAGCKASWDLEARAPCDHAGFAIASRIHACTGDAKAANAAFERFDRESTCQATKGNARPADFSCAIRIAEVDCDTTLELADDIDAWLALDHCPALFEPSESVADTGSLP